MIQPTRGDRAMHRCNVNAVTGCIALASMLLLDACTESSLVPTIQVIPGRGKSFWAFYDDRAFCRRSAHEAVRDEAQRANLQVTGFATPATVLGAGRSTATGRGRGGMLQSSNAENSVQAQFDNAFTQCMVSLGNSALTPQRAVRESVS